MLLFSQSTKRNMWFHQRALKHEAHLWLNAFQINSLLLNELWLGWLHPEQDQKVMNANWQTMWVKTSPRHTGHPGMLLRDTTGCVSLCWVACLLVCLLVLFVLTRAVHWGLFLLVNCSLFVLWNHPLDAKRCILIYVSFYASPNQRIASKWMYCFGPQSQRSSLLHWSKTVGQQDLWPDITCALHNEKQYILFCAAWGLA